MAPAQLIKVGLIAIVVHGNAQPSMVIQQRYTLLSACASVGLVCRGTRITRFGRNPSGQPGEWVLGHKTGPRGELVPWPGHAPSLA